MGDTVKDFVTRSYRIVTPSSPTVPLQNFDMSDGVQYLNELIRSYSATGLLLTVAKFITPYVMSIGQEEVIFADSDYAGPADVYEGRIANIENGYLLLDGVHYPLNTNNRNDFLQSYLYDPLQGLPRFQIVFPNIETTTLRIYPAPSQPFELHIYGKFELPYLNENSTISLIPGYMTRFLRIALAKDLAIYKGRMDGWTEKLEKELIKSESDMVAVSPINIKLNSDGEENLLNGNWRCQSGI